METIQDIELQKIKKENQEGCPANYIQEGVDGNYEDGYDPTDEYEDYVGFEQD